MIISLSEEEILTCIKGLKELWDNGMLKTTDINTILYLEKNLGITDTKEFIEKYGTD